METGDHLLLEDEGRIIIAEREVIFTGGGGAIYPRRLIPTPLRRRSYGWIDIDDEEFLLIIDDD